MLQLCHEWQFHMAFHFFWQNHNFFQDYYLHNRMLQLCCKNVILKMKRYFYIDVFILLSECNFATLYLKCYWLKMEVLLSISQFSAKLQLCFKIVGQIIQCYNFVIRMSFQRHKGIFVLMTCDFFRVQICNFVSKKFATLYQKSYLRSMKAWALISQSYAKLQLCYKLVACKIQCYIFVK